MRITQRSMHMGVERNLQGSLSALQRLQEQLSSGKLISRPSDSPASTVSALRYRADIRRAEQMSRNGDDAKGWLDVADRALMGQIELVNRARSLALQGLNASSGPGAKEALAAEIEQLRTAAIAGANASYLGRPVFAGTRDTPQAYSDAGTYLGDAGTVTRSVAPNVTVPVNLTGEAVFGPDGDNLFDVLGDMVTNLRSGDTDALRANVDELDVAFSRLTNSVAAIGARTHQVEAMKQRVESQILDSTNGLAEVESIDLPATIVKLQMQEVAYQAALGATARMIQPSLVDFLR